MSLDELTDVLLHHRSASLREKAADWIRDHRLVDATPALREACAPGRPESPCGHALDALASFRTGEARDALEAVLLDDTLLPARRKAALRLLQRDDRARAGHDALVLLSRYRSLDDELAVPLIQAMVEGGAGLGGDLAVLIASDVGARRRARLEALDAAATLRHPRLFEAELALLDDSDAKVRLRCAKDLGRSGLPGELVQPALLRVATLDADGGVRAAAWAGLRSYANGALVPALNAAVLREPHLVAWAHVFDLFTTLADASSVPTVAALLARDALIDDAARRLIGVAVRLGDPSVVPALQALRETTTSDVVRGDADRALAWLWGPPAPVPDWAVPVSDVVPWTPPTVTVALPPLALAIGPDGVVVGLPGVTVQAW